MTDATPAENRPNVECDTGTAAQVQRGAGLYVRVARQHPTVIDAELSCEPGELLAIVGPSGSGKTTLLRVIAGLARPRTGVVHCGGQTWTDLDRGVHRSPQQRRIGLVFQHYALFPHLSALDNVACALGHVPRRERAARARRLLALVHLEGLEPRMPSQLSGGQCQRVALARALAREPSVLLLDEPFSAVDQVTRRKLHQELVLLRRRINTPMVLVTHDLDEARALADRLCVLHHGTTLQTGPPMQVMTRPDSALVARLIDIGNVFEGVVEGHDRHAAVTWLRWQGYLLEARPAVGFAPGTTVSWVVPSSHVVLHRVGRPSRGHRENPVHGIAAEVATLGDYTTVIMHVDGDERTALRFSVPTHVAERNRVVPGTAISVSLLADGIHLLPYEAERSDDTVASTDRRVQKTETRDGVDAASARGLPRQRT